MDHRLTPLAILSAVALLAACSQESAQVEEEAASETLASPSAAPDAKPLNSPSATPVLALDGFDDLVIGKPVPESSSFALRGAQASDTCLIYSSTEYPGLYAIVEGDAVRRITVAGDSTVKLVEGIGVGSTEEEVLTAFPGFVSSPHKYVEAPAKYLQQPGNEPRLRFEIDTQGKVSAIHAGMPPQLEYVEGCS